ncbi:hypothetical protein [Streptomyces sp. STR69]|uniref:hypothetical protein n=1 Tax=Streptomyces sp. STR69 TaxID=1796942 RepID=UPI0021C72F54|nr:hypothetical protein [Streptomyces sp. STR69]
MMRFVSVRLRASLPYAWDPPRDTVPGLLLRVRSAGREFDVLAWVGLTKPGTPGDADDPVASVDEHVAVDAELCRQIPWSACADVLHDRHPRPFADAALRLVDIRAAYPGCLLAAAPLTGGGWAVTESTGRTVVSLARQVPPDQPLLASCLHAWLVAGHLLCEIEDIHVLYGR